MFPLFRIIEWNDSEKSSQEKICNEFVQKLVNVQVLRNTVSREHPWAVVSDITQQMFLKIEDSLLHAQFSYLIRKSIFFRTARLVISLTRPK